VRDSNWVVDILLLAVLVLDVHVVQAQVDLDVLLQVVLGCVGVFALGLYFLEGNKSIFTFSFLKLDFLHF
jgi:hypothetical protein